MNLADRELLSWVDRKLRTGAKVVEVPVVLVANATEEGLHEARSLATLSGAKLVVL